jgi:hypothetical protein
VGQDPSEQDDGFDEYGEGDEHPDGDLETQEEDNLTDEYLDDDNKDGIQKICTMMMCHRMGSKRMMGLKTRTGIRTLRMMSGLMEKIKTRKTALTKSKKT